MNYQHLASRVFGVPLLIERHKLDTILSVLAPRLGLESDGEVVAYGPGDTGRQRKDYFVTEDKIAVIDVVGPLVKRASGGFMSGGPTTYSQIETEFTDAATDPEIKGILLQVDSPGGESVGAFELSDLIYSQRGSKPIYAVADGYAFSAAYALASAAERLYITKSGGVGSVGVWMMHVDQSGFNEKEGVKPTYIFAGARKIDGNPHEPLSDEAREVFQSEVDRVYQMFSETVARNRKMPEKAVRKTEAGLFFGADGVDIGFADGVGTSTDALTDLRSAIARPLQSSRVAASAAAPIQLREVFMEEITQADAETTADVAPSAETIRAGTLMFAAEIAELCILGGIPQLAVDYIREGRDIERVRGDIQLARAQQDSEQQINSHVLPETSAASGWKATPATNPDDSPIVKAAERAAEQHAMARKGN